MDEVLGDRQVSGQQLRDTLALMLFRGEDVYKQMGMLSGGERARVRLAQLLLDRPNVLVLDEPTNHLDIASCEALEGALGAFEGTILCVSHDRYFLDQTVERRLVRDPAGMRDWARADSDWAEKTADEERLKAGRTTDAGRPKAIAPTPVKEKPPTKDGGRKRDNPYARPFGRLSLKELEQQITDT